MICTGRRKSLVMRIAHCTTYIAFAALPHHNSPTPLFPSMSQLSNKNPANAMVKAPCSLSTDLGIRQASIHIPRGDNEETILCNRAVPCNVGEGSLLSPRTLNSYTCTVYTPVLYIALDFFNLASPQPVYNKAAGCGSRKALWTVVLTGFDSSGRPTPPGVALSSRYFYNFVPVIDETQSCLLSSSSSSPSGPSSPV
jgi:hypothetical protein